MADRAALGPWRFHDVAVECVPEARAGHIAPGRAQPAGVAVPQVPTVESPARSRRVRMRLPTPGNSSSPILSRRSGRSLGFSTVSPSGLSKSAAILASHRLGAQPMEQVICFPRLPVRTA